MLTVGILGGMGPMATVDLFSKIVESTPAKTDQEHLKVIVYNNPQIPSRVNAIINNGKNPEEELVKSAIFLENSGADIIVMPCNTAHYWYDKIQSAIKIPLVNMIENTAIRLRKKYGSDNSTGIMLFATEATVKTGIYQKQFDLQNLKMLTPTADEQKVISAAIDQVKAGYIQNNPYLAAIEDIMKKYYKNGVKSFVAGCTEIPLLFSCVSGEFDKIDPTRLLAEEVVRRAYC